VAALRVTVGTALCEAGLDELALGKRWVRIIRNLAQKKYRENTAVQKLLFDVLKECTRQLDSDHEQGRAGAPVIVHLVHAVARPPRVIEAGSPAPLGAAPSAADPPVDGASAPSSTS
jgi:hypothetical protein